MWWYYPLSTLTDIGMHILKYAFGFHGRCNHICGILLWVKAAVKSGMTDLSCMSLPCQWNKLLRGFNFHAPVGLGLTEF